MSDCAQDAEPGMRCPCCGSPAIAMLHHCGTRTSDRCRFLCTACECDSHGAIGPEGLHTTPTPQTILDQPQHHLLEPHTTTAPAARPNHG